MGVSRKQSTANFPKNELFLPPDAESCATFLLCTISKGKKLWF